MRRGHLLPRYLGYKRRSAARVVDPGHRAWKHYNKVAVPWKLITAMSTAVWPPIEDARLADEQAASQARELEWLLVQLRETLQSLKAGLEECAALLAPSENGSTLVLSSVRSESLKGLITRIGTRITKGVCVSVSLPGAQNSQHAECEASFGKPPTTKRLIDPRSRYLVCTACAYARRSPAYVYSNVHQQLPGCHRRGYLGRRCDERKLRLRTATAAARSYTGSTGGVKGVLRRPVAVVGEPRRRQGRPHMRN
jgi:hypothetical protein